MQPSEHLDKAGTSAATWPGPDRVPSAPRSTPSAAARVLGSSDRNDDLSDVAEMDPVLVKLVELITRRLQAGESVDLDELAEEYPSWSGAIGKLMPTLRGLAELGRVVGADGVAPGVDDPKMGKGRAFGDFRIVREVGRGGMGIVYEAEQVPLNRRVALKVLPLAVAMDPRALQRFQLEAQVAGWLQHPRIVPVHAVGLVGDVPYYAMQYIEGGSLADLIAELRGLAAGDPASNPSESRLNALAVGLLSGRFAPPRREAESSRHNAGAPSSDKSDAAGAPSIRSRAYLRTVARLGRQAAEALGYAHDQGIVHRDVKPANLLLDQHGDLWVADFGMADVQGDAGLTLTGDLPGTLRYMSPEQALGRRALVDRRTDIYALGATLYELLTLQTAVHGADRQEILRRIAEEEPTPIRKINPAVPLDLATIVGKALAKDPSRRYETAWQFADDLGRFLEGLPIAARRAGPLTRAWSLCRRKPVQSGLVAALGLALAVGFGGIMWNWREAVRQKRLLVVAERESRKQAAKADAINRFLVTRLLGQASPENNPASSRVTLMEVLDRASAEVGSSFAGQPELEAATRLTIGRTYHGLGEYAKSEEHLRAAFAILPREGKDLGQARLEVMADLGHILCHLGRLDEAEPLLHKAVEESRRAFGPSHTISLTAAEYLADLRSSQGQYPEAEALYRRYLEEARRAPKPDQEVIQTALNNLGLVLIRQNKTNEAEVLFRDLMKASRLVRGPKHPGTLSVMNSLGTLLEKQGKLDEAERLFREGVDLNRAVHGPQHPATLTGIYNLAYVLKGLGRLDESETLFRQILALNRQILGPENPATLRTIGSLASVLRTRGSLDEAETLLRTCLDAQRRVLGPQHPETLKTAQRLDSLLSDRAGVGVAASSHSPSTPD